MQRFAVVIALALALFTPQSRAQDFVDYVRDWMLMGPNSGQRETDATQYHTEGTPSASTPTRAGATTSPRASRCGAASRRAT
jgi:hypothetical protein